MALDYMTQTHKLNSAATGDLIYDNAVYWAGVRRAWLVAAQGAVQQRFTRRQCLHRAREAEARIVDYAIKAECQALRDLSGTHA
jgi:hypothetical protein